MKHHEAIVNYKESLGTGSVSVNAVSQLFPGRESCDPLRGENNRDRVDTVALNAEKVQLGRKQLAEAKHGQTVAGQLVNRALSSMVNKSKFACTFLSKKSTGLSPVIFRGNESWHVHAGCWLDFVG